MNKEMLKRHKALTREVHITQKQLDNLYSRSMDIPVIAGKVKGSSKDFPYTETRTTVLMDEPVQSDCIKKLIRQKENLIKQDNEAIIKIEEFINAISDPETRQIFELSFYEGMQQKKVADIVGYSRGRISQIISDYLKD